MNNIIPNEDIEYFLSQNQAETAKIMAGMNAIIEGNEQAYNALKSQKWYQRIWKGITRQNKATVDNMHKNQEKLSVYCVQALSLIIQQKSVSDSMITNLSCALYNTTSRIVNLELLVEGFASKLNEKIISIDNYNDLITDIQNDKFDTNKPFISILDVLSRIDKRTAANPEKILRIKETLIKNNFDLNAPLSLEEITEQILTLNEDAIGRIYLLCQNHSELIYLNYCCRLIENYLYQPESNRPAIRDNAVKNALLYCGLNNDVEFNFSSMYTDMQNAISNSLSNITIVPQNCQTAQHSKQHDDLKLRNANRHIKVLVAGKDNSGISPLCNHLKSDYSIVTRQMNGFKIDPKNNEQIYNMIFDTIEKEKITAFLYCIELHSKRFESFEEQLVNEIMSKYPNLQVIVVITNNTNKKDATTLRNYIYSRCDVEVYPVLTDNYELDEAIIPANGLDKLVERLENI